MNWYNLKENICLTIQYACMLVVFVILVVMAVTLFRGYFLTGTIYNEVASIKDLIGGIFFTACGVAIAWCGIGILRA